MGGRREGARPTKLAWGGLGPGKRGRALIGGPLGRFLQRHEMLAAATARIVTVETDFAHHHRGRARPHCPRAPGAAAFALSPPSPLVRLRPSPAAALPFPVSLVSLSHSTPNLVRPSIHPHPRPRAHPLPHPLPLAHPLPACSRSCPCALPALSHCARRRRSSPRLFSGRGLPRCEPVAARANSPNPPRLHPRPTTTASTSRRRAHPKLPVN